MKFVNSRATLLGRVRASHSGDGVARKKKTFTELRETAGIGQRELARSLGLDPGTVWRWEVGRTEPRLRQLRTLAETLGCSVDDLIAAFEGQP